jgi:uroporphyrinogen-III decarboxylase
MTGKERILCTLAGEIPDRVPITLFVQQEYLSYYYGRNDTDRVKDAALLAEELGFDLMTRQTVHMEPHYARKSAANWELNKREYIEGGNCRRLLEIKTPGGVLSQIESAPYDPKTIGGIHFITTKYMINTDTDFELFRKYMPPMDKEYAGDMKSAAIEAQKYIGSLGVSCPWGTGGVFNAAVILRDISQLLMDPYEDEDFYGEFMDFLSSLLERDYALLAETAHECIGMQGNMANAKIIGPDFFKQYIQPYEVKLINAVKSRGKSVLYHNCGPARNLYDRYKEMNMTIFETLSPRPQGDNDFAEAKQELGKTMVISGNLDQIHFLKTAAVEEVKAATEKLIGIGKPGEKYLFATSDYLEPLTPLENIKAMIGTAKSCGRY